ncbi:MAG: hydantoinase/oxoprolinase family protein, partial [Rhodococcus sp. (in: high G+C Gram-positive bacteria)]|nr:hydantoinase/oxoprolinase family protein [Rhodococcus sp. (in: high G+C Gram-positive bacteria)]
IYSKRYGEGSAAPEAGIRVQTIRVASYVNGETVEFDSLHHDGERTLPAPVGHRDVHFGAHPRAITTAIYDADALSHHHVIPGPAIVTTENTTYLVEPGWRLEPSPQGAVWFLKD